MHKEDIVNEIVNLRIQIANLKLQEKGLCAQLEVIRPMDAPKIVTRKEVFKVLPPIIDAPVRKTRTPEQRARMAAAQRKHWASMTSEQRAEKAAAISRGHKKG